MQLKIILNDKLDQAATPSGLQAQKSLSARTSSESCQQKIDRWTRSLLYPALKQLQRNDCIFPLVCTHYENGNKIKDTFYNRTSHFEEVLARDPSLEILERLLDHALARYGLRVFFFARTEYPVCYAQNGKCQGYVFARIVPYASVVDKALFSLKRAWQIFKSTGLNMAPFGRDDYFDDLSLGIR